jgi:hypothetical protein
VSKAHEALRTFNSEMQKVWGTVLLAKAADPRTAVVHQKLKTALETARRRARAATLKQHQDNFKERQATEDLVRLIDGDPLEDGGPRVPDKFFHEEHRRVVQVLGKLKSSKGHQQYRTYRCHETRVAQGLSHRNPSHFKNVKSHIRCQISHQMSNLTSDAQPCNSAMRI